MEAMVMRISPVGIEPPRIYLPRKVHEKLNFSVKDLELHVQKSNNYGFTRIDLSVLSARVETKNFSVKMVEISVEKASVSMWRKNANDYTLKSFASKEFDWMAGYVSRETGIDKKKALEMFKDLLERLSKGFDVSEKYIANALRRLDPSLDPKKAMKIAKDMKIFLKSISNLLRLHRGFEYEESIVEILKMSLKEYTFTEGFADGKNLESLA